MTEPSLMDRILDPGALSVRFQPVYEVHASVTLGHYLECLIRGPRGTSVESPEILFEYARNKNRESDVDRRCVSVILEAARNVPPHVRLGLNGEDPQPLPPAPSGAARGPPRHAAIRVPRGGAALPAC